MRYAAHLTAWENKMKREGYVIQAQPGSEQEKAERVTGQKALAAVLSTMPGVTKL